MPRVTPRLFLPTAGFVLSIEDRVKKTRVQLGGLKELDDFTRIPAPSSHQMPRQTAVATAKSRRMEDDPDLLLAFDLADAVADCDEPGPGDALGDSSAGDSALVAPPPTDPAPVPRAPIPPRPTQPAAAVHPATAASAFLSATAEASTIVVEPHSKLRVSHWDYPPAEVSALLAGRVIHTLKAIATAGDSGRYMPKDARAPADWTTIGVLGRKSETKMSKSDSKYQTWQLTDYSVRYRPSRGAGSEGRKSSGRVAAPGLDRPISRPLAPRAELGHRHALWRGVRKPQIRGARARRARAGRPSDASSRVVPPPLRCLTGRRLSVHAQLPQGAAGQGQGEPHARRLAVVAARALWPQSRHGDVQGGGGLRLLPYPIASCCVSALTRPLAGQEAGRDAVFHRRRRAPLLLLAPHHWRVQGGARADARAARRPREHAR